MHAGEYLDATIEVRKILKIKQEILELKWSFIIK
jgi:hypothetical protein